LGSAVFRAIRSGLEVRPPYKSTTYDLLNFRAALFFVLFVAVSPFRFEADTHIVLTIPGFARRRFIGNYPNRIIVRIG
jgi:hypothetical protein